MGGASWSDARTSCESLGPGGGLALIKDKSTQSFLEEHLPSPFHSGYYIGAYESGKWTWDGSKIIYNYHLSNAIDILHLKYG